MPLKVGAKAPEFKLKSTSGEDFIFSNRMGKHTLLYFYPKDFTYGCTQQACNFRDEFSSFRDLEIDVFGINKDSITTHKDFIKELDLPFELLSDPLGEVCKKYKAVIPFVGTVKRITYLINPDLKIEAVYDSMMGFNKHVGKILRNKK